MLNLLINSYQRYAARRMFSRWSPIYEEEVTENAYSAADRVAQSTLKHLAESQIGQGKASIADIGIGTGLLAQQIYDAIPCNIIGLDFTEDMMAVCMARDITELLIKCDAGKDHWPIVDDAQDCVIAAGLFEYLTPAMVQHFLNESKRVLKGNGLLVFSYMPREKDEKQMTLWPGHSGTFLTCSYTEEEIERFLKQNDFAIIEHSARFAGSTFEDGSSYDYRLISARSLKS